MERLGTARWGTKDPLGVPKLLYAERSITWVPTAEHSPAEVVSLRRTEVGVPIPSPPNEGSGWVSLRRAQEREDRAEFAYEACIVSRDRLIRNDVFRYFGWDVEESRQALVDRGLNADFLNMLYARVIPNLKRIGLLTDRVRPKFEEMGVLDFENLATDGDIDWRALERPLDFAEAA